MDTFSGITVNGMAFKHRTHRDSRPRNNTRSSRGMWLHDSCFKAHFFFVVVEPQAPSDSCISSPTSMRPVPALSIALIPKNTSHREGLR